jgi:hypothetical protein
VWFGMNLQNHCAKEYRPDYSRFVRHFQ